MTQRMSSIRTDAPPAAIELPKFVKAAADLNRAMPDRLFHSRLHRLIVAPLRAALDVQSEYLVPLAGCRARVICSPKSSIEASVIESGYWERRESKIIDKYVTPSSAVIDVGANVGIHACRMAALAGESGTVFAFEPHSEFAARLKRNAEINGFGIRLFPWGVSDVPGDYDLYVNGESNPNRNATIVVDPENRDTVRQTIRLVRLDDVWEQFMDKRLIRFLKMDIEGYEFFALRAAAKMLKHCKPVILAEYSEYYASLLGYSWLQLAEYYLSLGYSPISLDGARLYPTSLFHKRANFNYLAIPN